VILDLLENVRETGAGRYLARCPAHDDNRPSLSIRVIEGDRTLVHCFAGCTALEVVNALGLEYRDLFHDSEIRRFDWKRRDVPRLSAAEKLELVEHELTVGALILSATVDLRTISQSDWTRLAQAASRIGKARNA
jgi:hypothetical protein